MADLGQAVATLSEALEVASQFGTEDELRSATDLVDAIYKLFDRSR